MTSQELQRQRDRCEKFVERHAYEEATGITIDGKKVTGKIARVMFSSGGEWVIVLQVEDNTQRRASGRSEYCRLDDLQLGRAIVASVSNDTVLMFFEMHEGKKARGQTLSDGTLITGTIADMAWHTDSNHVACLNVRLEVGGIKYAVLYTSLQILDQAGTISQVKSTPVMHDDKEKHVREFAQKAKPCHTECTDGWCHRSYIS